MKILKWFLMLSKRLYKKPSFVVLLLLIPICISAFTLIAKKNSGFVHIVLAQTNSKDKISAQIIDELSKENSLISFTTAPSEKEAIKEVENGLADEAWVFAYDTEDIINNFPDSEHAVSIYTKEQSVPLRLVREKLTGVVYKYCAKAYYIDYIRANFSKLDDVTDEQLSVYFENASIDDSLFSFENPNNAASKGTSNYLTSPIRGLMAIFVVLCGMAATMYYAQDEKAGTFSYIKSRYKELAAFGCVITAVINVSVVVCLSLFISSLSGNIATELLTFLLYAVCSTSFCLLLKSIFTSLRAYSALIPLLTVVFIGICPVFFDFRKLYAVQMLLPPTYYVNSMYDHKYLIYMGVYSVVCIVLSALLKVLKNLTIKR